MNNNKYSAQAVNETGIGVHIMWIFLVDKMKIEKNTHPWCEYITNNTNKWYLNRWKWINLLLSPKLLSLRREKKKNTNCDHTLQQNTLLNINHYFHLKLKTNDLFVCEILTIYILHRDFIYLMITKKTFYSGILCRKINSKKQLIHY